MPTELLRAIRHAARYLTKAKGFTSAAVLTLALGIGAAATIYTVADHVLLRPLPFAAPDRIVAVWPDRFFSNREFELYRDQTRVLTDLATVSPGWKQALTGLDQATQLTAALVSPNYFNLLGTAPALGRAFAPDESVPGRTNVAVLGHGIWVRLFGADPGIVGRTIQLDGTATTVIGVMPSTFEPLQVGTELWRPMRMDPDHWTYASNASLLVGRLGAGRTTAGATTELVQVLDRMRTEFGYPAEFGRGATVVALRDSIVGDYAGIVFSLLGAVSLMLLIAAASVSNLVVARGVDRARTVATQLALGARRRRIAGQLLIEAALLAAAAATLGLGFAVLAVRALAGMLPPEMPRVDGLGVGPDLVGPLLAATALLALLLAIASSLPLARVEAQRVLRGAGVVSARGAARVRSALLIGQIALALVLGVGAALMVTTLRNLNRVDPGFRGSEVLALMVQPNQRSYPTGAAVTGFYDRLLDRVGALSGVRAAGAIQHLPLSGYSWMGEIGIEGVLPPPGATPPQAGLRAIAGDYFAAMGIPLVDGRVFGAGDREDAPAVAIVNRAFAAQHWPDGSAVGRRIRFGPDEDWTTVVGVVDDVRHTALDRTPVPEVYRPFAQWPLGAMWLAVRTAGPPATFAGPIRAAIHEFDPDVPVADIRPMERLVSLSYQRQRTVGVLLSAFSLFGIVVVAVGLYGVVRYAVDRRRRELALRIALGAQPGRILRQVVGDAIRLAAPGVALGVAAALLLADVLEPVLFGIEPTSPWLLAAIAAGIAMLSVLASLSPARRAAATDPAEALRE